MDIRHMSPSNKTIESWYKQILALTEALELSRAKEYTQYAIDARQLNKIVFENVVDPIWKRIQQAGDKVSRNGHRVYFEFKPAERGFEENSAFKKVAESPYVAELLSYVDLGIAHMTTVKGGMPDSHINSLFESVFTDKVSSIAEALSIGTVRGDIEFDAYPLPFYFHHHAVADLINGTVTYTSESERTGRVVKTEKFNTVLKMLIRKGYIPAEYAQKASKALEVYNTLKSNLGSVKPKPYQIVISRHAIDLAGMSTDRGWGSCMRLPTKKDPTSHTNKKYVRCDVEAGTFIAYLIKEGDENINKPVARILIKPYFNKDKSTVYYMTEAKHYGTAPSNFKSTVDSILNSIQPKEQLPFGRYSRESNLYPDGGVDSFKVAGSDERIRQAIEFRIPNKVLDLSGEDMSKMDLSGMNLSGINFAGANLTEAVLTQADLTEADLSKANLTGADLTGADLTGADLTGANLYEAYLRRADLTGANLRNITSLETCRGLNTVKYSESTTWPVGFNIRYEILNYR